MGVSNSLYALKLYLRAFTFFIYVIDLPQNVCPTKSVLFADDITLTVFERNSTDLTVSATLAMPVANDWFMTNNLRFNLVKTKLIHFIAKSNANFIIIQGEEEI